MNIEEFTKVKELMDIVYGVDYARAERELAAVGWDVVAAALRLEAEGWELTV